MRSLLVLFMSMNLFVVQTECNANELEQEVLDRVKAACVFVKVRFHARHESQGSGFFVRPNIVVTSAQVLGQTARKSPSVKEVEIVVSSSQPQERSVVADLLCVDTEYDLAFLRVPLNHNSVLRASNGGLKERKAVFICGFPLGQLLDLERDNPAVTVGSGSLSSLRFAKNVLEEIQVDGNLIPGNGGGPIVDNEGMFLGVANETVRGAQRGFAIPAARVEQVLAGRVSGLALSSRPHETDPHRFQLTCEATILDPLKQIENPLVEVAIVPPSNKAPFDSSNSILTSELEYKGNLEWTVDFSSLSIATNESLWVRVREGKGFARTLHNPLDYTDEVLHSYRIQFRARKLAQMVHRHVDAKPNRDFEPRRPPSTVSAIVGEQLNASRETDDDGHPYIRATSREKKIRLGAGPLVQVVVEPSGERLFAISKYENRVRVYNTVDFTQIDEITVAKDPVSMWCDSDQLVVACSVSRLVTLIDLETLKIRRSIRVTTDNSLSPCAIMGKTVDGRLKTAWSRADAPRERHLYTIDNAGKAEKILQGDVHWCIFPADDSFLVVQSDFASTGSISKYDLRRRESVRFPKELFEPQEHSLGGMCGHIVRSFDRRQFYLPTEVSGWGNRTKTIVLDKKFSRVEGILPGSLIAEVPEKNLLIAWQDRRRKDSPDLNGAEILYISRSNGRVIRRVQVPDFSAHPMCFQQRARLPNLTFIPGREILIYQDHNGRDANELRVMRTGPVNPLIDVTADPSMAAMNQPPKKVYVGKSLVFSPLIPNTESTSTVAFVLEKAIPGMRIDETTGKLTFQPTDANLGIFEVSIVAMVDGIRVPVIEWDLEIEYSP